MSTRRNYIMACDESKLVQCMDFLERSRIEYEKLLFCHPTQWLTLKCTISEASLCEEGGYIVSLDENSIFLDD
jgi:hypothetical protein